MSFRLRDFISDTVMPVVAIVGGAMTGGLAGGLLMASGGLTIAGKNLKDDRLLKLGRVAGLAAVAVGGYQALTADKTAAVGSGANTAGENAVAASQGGAEAGLTGAANAAPAADAVVGETAGTVAGSTSSTMTTPLAGDGGLTTGGGTGILGSQSGQIGGIGGGEAMIGASSTSPFSLPSISPTTGLIGATMLGGAVQGRAAEKQTEEARRQMEQARADKEAERVRLNQGILNTYIPVQRRAI
jgi:hypothetical protein